MKKIYQYLLAFMITLFYSASYANVTVNLQGQGQAQAIPITISSFDGDTTQVISQVLANDLTHSGQFEVFKLEQVINGNHLPQSTHYVVSGEYNGRQATLTLWDSSSKTAIARFHSNRQNLRQLAHELSDQVYQTLTGVQGIFSTKIAYTIGNTLYLADYDGDNAQIVVQATAPILSPAWSPDGAYLAYTSLELDKPVVFTINLHTGERKIVANFKGNNSAPAWSPDGQTLAVALSGDAISNIYLIAANGSSSKPQKLTYTSEIDTEPVFFPNNSGIIFTSDRSGSAQIYRTGLTPNGLASRLTYSGTKNINPAISSDGTKIAYSSLRNGHYVIAVQPIGGTYSNVLTDGDLDLSPTFSPNNMQILYLDNGQLSLVSLDGNYHYRFPLMNNISSVAWGPYATSSFTNSSSQ
ncbi:PD40 domain-containing protein [Basilea psittacipulmonis]|uniref:PD40 domain-containing protein n=1 Tax=Basilea psittacipulmonis TaxID=1472345 RepID=UPI00068FCFA3|nr:PD40 domain-containing protein [Basilea psittacipulmonis]